MRLVLSVLLLVLLPFGATAACLPSQADRADLSNLLAAHNAARATAGLAPLARSARLDRAAQLYACVMAQRGWFKHTGPDGRRFSDRIRAAGCTARAAVSENIAMGRLKAPGVMRLWLGSPGHRRNLLAAGSRNVGFGVATAPDGSRYWVADFSANCP